MKIGDKAKVKINIAYSDEVIYNNLVGTITTFGEMCSSIRLNKKSYQAIIEYNKRHGECWTGEPAIHTLNLIPFNQLDIE